MPTMEQWQRIMRDSITTYEELNEHFPGQHRSLEKVIATFPMRINPYFLALIKKHGHPLSLQAIPSIAELQDTTCIPDPLNEENLSPTPNLVHRYPDRALLLLTSNCAMFCRFCTRKRKVGNKNWTVDTACLDKAYDYLRENRQIREVILSGGDPLLLDDDRLSTILSRLRAIKSIEVIRIGTRVPATLPMRVTEKLTRMFTAYHPLFINTHFNHPFEITKEAAKACRILADAGIPLGNHTVLLKGVNDDAKILRSLFLNLLKMRIKPYYLFQADLTRGTDHFRTPIDCGIDIMRQIIGHISGMAVPTYAIDAPGGKGKIPLTPNYITDFGNMLHFQNYLGESCSYPDATK
ncbi:unnamed protein product [Cyprideis torosa]|uniref:Uncharacterized protein n=1 Tax=Cyprideis torosa TaxID=163714 RepID=A0A7R8WQZ7_9CRUS|nr:unnamed protein product [Cyprideis torosa]CAG0903246.1 unnamed protein product [Cyprideis torosa]